MISYIGKCLLIEDRTFEKSSMTPNKKRENKKILVVGDLHLGFEEAMNRTGVFIGRKMYEEMVGDFDLIFSKVEKVDEIVLLGDVKHGFGRNLNQEWEESGKLFGYLHGKCDRLVIVKGNHDNYLENITNKFKIEVRDYYKLGGYVFLHGDRDFPEIKDKEIVTWIIGHAHPAVKIGTDIRKETYKCFLVGKFLDKEIIIVPSFFGMREGSDLREYESNLAWDFDLGKFRVKILRSWTLET